MKHLLLLLKKITPTLALAALMLAPVWGWGQIVAWESDGLTGGGTAPWSAATIVANIQGTPQITVGSGCSVPSGTPAENAFLRSAMTASDKAGAISGNDYFQYSIAASSGYKISYSTIDANFRRTGTGANNFIFQYSLDGFATAGIDIGTSTTYTSVSNGVAITQITLSGISALQNVTAPVYFRLYWWGESGTTQSAGIGRLTGNDLAIGGIVEAASVSAPTIQASNITFASIAGNSMTANWTNGDGAKRVVIMNTSNSFTNPTDGTDPAANTVYSGSGEQVVYNNSSNSVAVTGLSASTTYWFRAYEYNGSGATTKFLTSTATDNPNSQATTAACAENPTIATTVAANTITPTTASSGGQGLSAGTNCSISVKGVCWNTTGNPTSPTTADPKTTDGSGVADYTSSLTSLTAQTQYFVRAYATNGFGTAYGPEVSFRTLSTELAAHPASFTATAASSSQINLAFSAASTITNADGYILLRRTGSNPSATNITDGIAPTALTMPSGTTFLADINSTSTTTYNSTGLPNPNTQYNYTIFAYNWDGVNPATYNYYTATSFKTISATTFATAVTLPYTQDFEGTTSEWIIETSGTNKWAIGSATSNGGTKSLYISNNGGTNNAYTITTAANTAAFLSVDLTGVTAATLSFDWKSRGEFSFDYGEVYLFNGVTTTLISDVEEFVGTTVFATKVINLTPYVGGVIQLQFIWENDDAVGTQPPMSVDNVSIVSGAFPAVTTTAVSSINVTSASSGGNVTNDGGSTITSRGVCWNTSGAPTIADPKTTDGTGTGSYVSTITGLTDNTLYYVRAYATNSSGTAYGDVVSFTTTSISAPIANAANPVGSTSFTANWNETAGAISYALDVSTSATFGTLGAATLNEGFESGMPATYNSGTYTLGSGSWVLVNAGKSTNPANNHNSTAGGCQLQGGTSASATSPSLNTVGNVTFWAIRGTNATSVQVQKVISGVPTTVQTIVLTTTMTQYTVNVNDNSPAVQINFLNGANVAYIDDVSIGYTAIVPSFVSGYNNLNVGNVTSYSVTANLSPITNYYYRVRAVGTNSTSVNSGTIPVTTGNAIQSVAASNWNNTLTWNPAQIPTGIDDVTITASNPVNVDIAGAVCAGLAINASSSLTINSGKSLTVNGTLTNAVGASGLVIKSDATGTGSLIHSTAGVAATVERYLAPYVVLSDQMFHFISSPVVEQTIQPVFVTDPITTGEDFYSFDEATNYWINTRAAGDVWNTAFKTTNGGTDNFVVGKGYLVAYKPAVTKNFIGTLNSAQEVLTCTNTSGQGNGWNLLGNPFPSAIDWTAVTLGDGMDNALYYYDNTAAKYRYHLKLTGDVNTTLGTGQQYIPAMQGFMVHAKNSGTKTVTIPTLAKTHLGQNVFYKSVQTVPGSLVLTVAANGHEDEAFIHFNSRATTTFDGAYDAYKLRSYSPSVPNLFTKGSDNSELAINGLPEVDASTVIPVFFEAAAEGAHTLTANLEGLPNAIVNLVDIKLNQTQNLKENPVYSFTASNGDNANRFKLTFASVGINNPEASEGAQVYAHDGVLYVETTSKEAALVNVYNLTGQLVMQGKTGGDTLSTFNATALGTGVYVVNVILNEGVVSRKVVIRK